jgi:hypothetical protein
VADPVAIIGILSGASVALGVPFINSRLERRRMEHQSRDARLSELRELLDDAVIHLFAGYNVLYLIGQERNRALIVEIRDFAGVIEPSPVVQETELLRAVRSVPDRVSRFRE